MIGKCGFTNEDCETGSCDKNCEHIHDTMKKEISAKSISKGFKFVSTFGILICAILKWCGFMPNASASEICMIWAVVYGLGAGTIDLNIMFDKFTSNGRR